MVKKKPADRQHAYWLNDRRCKSITTVAKIPDNTYALEQWRKRMVALGMAMSPPLVEQAAAHFDDRDRLDQIAEAAMRVAKAHEAGERGTALHRIAERVDLDLDWIETPTSLKLRADWLAALEHAELEIVPELVERIVVYPEHMLCGRFDRICRRKNGSLVMVDLKTGEQAIKYPHTMAIQLGLYAYAPR